MKPLLPAIFAALAWAASDAAAEVAPGGPAQASLSALAAPRGVAGNPYIARLAAGARAELARPDPADGWPHLDAASAPGYFTLRGSGDSRDARAVAARLDAYLWLFANPASPLRRDKALLGRFLRRAHAYAEAINLSGRAGALRGGHEVRDESWIDRSRAILHRQRGHVLPDGATRYIWSQNECLGYHDTVADYLARLHEISRDPFAWLTSGLRSDLALGRTWSAFAADYQLHAFGEFVEIRPARAAGDAIVEARDQAGAAALAARVGTKAFTIRRDAAAAPHGLPTVRVEVASPDPADHEPPWADFANMASSNQGP
jgi:hypothetical protein